MKSFDTPVKRRIRAEYRSFLKETVLRHKKPSDVRVLCLPGWEAVEIFDVYDRLGIPRKNIYAIEVNPEAFVQLKMRNLGIHLWQGDVFDYLGHTGMTRLVGVRQDVTLFVDSEFVKRTPICLEEVDDRGRQFIINDPKLHGVPGDNPGIPPDWLKLSFDIIALDICGHITAKVVNSLSTMFRAGLLNDKGVFTLTSLAMREHPVTNMLIQMAYMMDTFIRGTMWDAAHNIRPNMVKHPYESDDSFKRDYRQRAGIDALVMLLGFGNELFTELLVLYKLTMEGKLLTDIPRNNIFDKILLTEFDETAMIVREVRRFAYQSDHSSMRTSFVYFKKAAKAIRETGSLMEIVWHLGHWLGSKITEIETPILELPKATVLDRIRKGAYTEA